VCVRNRLGSRQTAAMVIAVAALAGQAHAGLYQPSFAGPALDPSLSAVIEPGQSYELYQNQLYITETRQSSGADARFDTNFSPTGDFDAVLTVDRSNFQLASQFDFMIDFGGFQQGIYSGQFGALRYEGFFGNGLTGNTINSTGPTSILELTRVGDTFSSFVDGELLYSAVMSPTAPLSIFFGVRGANNQDFSIVKVRDFRITTPEGGGGCAPALARACPAAGVPEPETWALLIAGFAGAGLALRRRRVALG
jgi:hypothetical protein